jgi:large subunit ribosomal protein L25
MDQIVITAQPRSVTGKKVKLLRREGLIPLVVYGRKTEPINIQAVEFDTNRAISSAGGQLMSLQIEGEDAPRAVLARDIQRDVLTGAYMHVDLYEVDVTERLQVEVPVVLVGEAHLASIGEAVMLQVLNAVHIECLPTEIMQSIELDASKLVEFSDALYVSDLSLPEGIDVLTPADEMIARLQAIQEEEEEEEEELLFGEEEPGEVEVIQRGKEEEEEEVEE